MTLEPPELEMRKVRVTINMKPIVIVDKYVKVPTEETILKHLAEEIERGVLKEHFQIVISAEE